MTENYDWRVQVLAYGQRDGWTSKLVDTPHFELHSNAQYGGIWTQDDAARVAARMFVGLLQDGDNVYVQVCDLDGRQSKAYEFDSDGKLVVSES